MLCAPANQDTTEITECLVFEFGIWRLEFRVYAASAGPQCGTKLEAN